MSEKLDEETEKALSAIGSEKYVTCGISFKDDGTEDVATIKLDDSVEDDDDEIFFYCTGINDFRHLLNPDNGEDFVVNWFSAGVTHWERK